MKKALITGITGQDGSYLAELLLEKGYEIHGIIRRSSTINTKRIDHIFDKLRLHYGDMTDSLSLDALVSEIKPDEIYHLAAQSHVKVSFELPEYTGMVDALGTLKLLEAARKHCPKARVYLAETSELYGGIGKNMPETGYSETSAFHPRSPYGVAKLYSFWIGKNYREAYGMFVVNGILFNHESERRGETFVTRKITLGLAKIRKALDAGENPSALLLGNLYSKRDWGYAPDYVRGMWAMLQNDSPEDFVLATGETHTIKEFADEAARVAGFDLVWEGTGVNERAVDKKTGKTIIAIDARYFRPAEVDVLLGDYAKAKRILNWKPTVTFKELAARMMRSDLGHQ